MTTLPEPYRIRSARPADAAAVYGLILELARYEKLEHECLGSAEELAQDLATEPAPCGVLVLEDATAIVGYALYFSSYSTFWTRSCLYLEDLYVSPTHRGKGLGKALLTAVAGIAQSRRCPRLDWSVLDWNRPAIEFYEALGATIMPDWRTCRLEGEALARIATQ